MDLIAQRYAPMKWSHYPGFPDRIPHIDWQSGLSKFKGQDDEDASFHLVKFHLHIHKSGVYLPEDCLMKMFMVTLEEDMRSWYEILQPGSFYSMKYLHTTIFEDYRENYPPLLLFEDCCENYENFIEYLEYVDGIGVNGWVNLWKPMWIFISTTNGNGNFLLGWKRIRSRS